MMSAARVLHNGTDVMFNCKNLPVVKYLSTTCMINWNSCWIDLRLEWTSWNSKRSNEHLNLLTQLCLFVNPQIFVFLHTTPIWQYEYLLVFLMNLWYSWETHVFAISLNDFLEVMMDRWIQLIDTRDEKHKCMKVWPRNWHALNLSEKDPYEQNSFSHISLQQAGLSNGSL